MMRLKLSKIHFPTVLGLLILLVAIGVGVFLVQTRTKPNIGAEANQTPNQVRITNVTDTGFSVSWITSSEIFGNLIFGPESNSIKQTALDERDQLSGDTGSFPVHHVNVSSLKPSTKYYFKIESGGKQFDNQGKPFEVTTGKTLGTPPAADPIYGTILSTAGTPAEGVVVYINVANAAPLSALAKTNGNWALSLSTARSTDLSSYLNYDTQATIVNLLVQGGKLGTAPAITTTTNDSPVPDITLGKSHDFRTAAVANSTDSDDDQATDVTGFSLTSISSDSASIATPSGDVTLENPSFNGEVLNATQPAFIGSGPPGTVLAIEINSAETYTGSVTVNEDGEWEFSPPAGLEPGEHSITINYVDSGGLEQVLTRSFVVTAAGESTTPAITATPSAGAATDSGRTSMPSTDSGIPTSGSTQVTLLMFLTGLGLLVGGLTVKNRV